jgi:gamma-glutamyltranspeptidase
MITSRPQVLAQQHAISAGHELATKAGMEILEAGGNAIDAGVAAGMALGILHSDLVNFAGVAPIMIRMAETGKQSPLMGWVFGRHWHPSIILKKTMAVQCLKVFSGPLCLQPLQPGLRR